MLGRRAAGPIPSGRVSVKSAVMLAVVLMGLGVAAAACVGQGSLLIAGCLCMTILSYDSLLKRTPLGPLVMGSCRFLNVMLGYTKTPGESLAAALAAAKKAATLDDKDPAAYLTLGRVHMMRGEHDTSIAELEMSLRLNPSFAPAYFGLGFALALAGRFDEALGALDKAIRLNPRDPLIWAIKAIRSLTYSLLHQYEAAAEWAQQSIREPRAAGYWPYAVLASALGNLGQIEEARSAVNEALRQKPDLSLSYLEKTLPTKQPGELQPYFDGLRRAGLPE